jgi:hypothetical protein
MKKPRNARTTDRETSPQRTPRNGPVMPFSLVLEPREMGVLRKIARERRTSVADVVRGALHATIYRAHPEVAKRIIEEEVTTFIGTVGRRLTGQRLGSAQMASLRRQVVSALTKK